MWVFYIIYGTFTHLFIDSTRQCSVESGLFLGETGLSLFCVVLSKCFVRLNLDTSRMLVNSEQSMVFSRTLYSLFSRTCRLSVLPVLIFFNRNANNSARPSVLLQHSDRRLHLARPASAAALAPLRRGGRAPPARLGDAPRPLRTTLLCRSHE